MVHQAGNTMTINAVGSILQFILFAVQHDAMVPHVLTPIQDLMPSQPLTNNQSCTFLDVFKQVASSSRRVRDASPTPRPARPASEDSTHKREQGQGPVEASQEEHREFLRVFRGIKRSAARD